MASVEMIVKGADGNLIKQPIAAPVGSVIAFAADAVPAHTLECNGAAISITAYPELFAVIGTTYGTGNGTTTYNIPDFQGKFLRAVGGNSAAIGAVQEDAIRNITGTLAGVGTNFTAKSAGTGAFSYTNDLASESIRGLGDNYSMYAGTFAASMVVPTSNENRPVNMAVKYCIIYE